MTAPSSSPEREPLFLGTGTISVRCTACQSTFRFRRLSPSTVSPAPVTWCPICGAHGTTSWCDEDQDCWEVLADAFGLTIQQTKVAYAAWVLSPQFVRMGDFVERIKAGAARS